MKVTAIQKVTTVSLELTEDEAVMLYLLVGNTAPKTIQEATSTTMRVLYKNFSSTRPQIANLTDVDWGRNLLSPLHKSIGDALNIKAD